MSGEDEGIGRRDGVVWINEGATVAPTERIKEHEMSKTTEAILCTDVEGDSLTVMRLHGGGYALVQPEPVHVATTNELRKIAANLVAYADAQDRPEPITIEVSLEVAESYARSGGNPVIAGALRNALAERKAATS